MIDIAFNFQPDSKGNRIQTFIVMLNTYQKILWSKQLPNGDVMDFQSGRALFVLKWKDFCFTSDTIIIEMRSQKNKKIINQV